MIPEAPGMGTEVGARTLHTAYDVDMQRTCAEKQRAKLTGAKSALRWAKPNHLPCIQVRPRVVLGVRQERNCSPAWYQDLMTQQSRHMGTVDG